LPGTRSRPWWRRLAAQFDSILIKLGLTIACGVILLTLLEVEKWLRRRMGRDGHGRLRGRPASQGS
jgi:hypothetical protein